MTPPTGQPLPRVAIACGGTGGHLFPGLAVAAELRLAGCEPCLLVSEKEIDRLALGKETSFQAFTLPAVGLSRGRKLAFFRGFAQAFRQAAGLFGSLRPAAVLSMGGFTGAPSVLAARRCGARAFLHESNAIAGKANRWISWVTDRAFVGFPSAANRLHSREVLVTGTPVRPGFVPGAVEKCRRELGLDSERPVLLVTGGSQGARGINCLIADALPALARRCRDLQLIWLTGAEGLEAARKACAQTAVPALVHSFWENMEVALGAATLAVSRAGASSLAEFAAMRLPPVLIPYPDAADQHQLLNARLYEKSRAAVVCEQALTSPVQLAAVIADLISDSPRLSQMRSALGSWHTPDAARRIAAAVMEKVTSRTHAAGHCAQNILASPAALA